MRFLKPGLIQVVCLAILLSACGGEDARKASYLEKGKAYYEEGNYDKAKIEYKNVLQIDPKFAEGHYMMGLLQEKLKNIPAAFKRYQKTIVIDPLHIKAQAKLGRIYLMGSDTDRAKETYDKINAIAPNSIEGKLLKLLIMARTSDEGAIAFAEAILAEDKVQLDVIQILSELYIKGNELDKSIKTLKEGIVNIPTSAVLRLKLANNYMKAKDNSNVEKLLKEVVALDPERVELHANLASFYSQINELDKAEQVLRHIISLDPTDEVRYILLVDFQAKRKNVREAEKTLLSAIEKYPEGFKLRFALADLYKAIKSKKYLDIYNEIVSIKGNEPDGLRAKVELAKYAMSNNDLETTNQLVKEILDHNARDAEALLLKGKIAAIRKDYITAISTFRAVVKDQPDLVEAVSFLAATHLENNEPELASDVLASGITNAPNNPVAYLNYASYLQKKGDVRNAEQVVDKLLALIPKNLDGLKMKVKFASSRRDMNEVKSAIENIKVAQPKNPDGYQMMGDYYAAIKEYPQALAEYESALEYSKKLLPSMASIIKVYLMQSQYEKAVDRLNMVIKEQPKNAIPYELLGEVYLAQKKYVQAEKMIQNALKINKDWSLPYLTLAGVHLAQKNIQGAMQVYQDALKIFPKETRIMAKLAQIYESMNDHEKAIKVYEDILSVDPRSPVAANNLAVMLADRKGDTASLQRAKELVVGFENSSNAGFLDTLGWIYYKLGEIEKAVPILEKVVEKANHMSIFQYHLGMAYYKAGNQTAAKTHLNKALESGEKFQGREEAEQVIKNL